MRRNSACRGEIKVIQHNAVLNGERLLFDEKSGQEGDPSSHKALLRLTAKNGLDVRTWWLEEADN
jgi:hypothetical protein